MYRTLSDLRILRLAIHLEETFERYEEYLRDRINEVPVRARLAVLFEGGPHHRQLRGALEALEKRAVREELTLDTEDLLQTLIECETFARDFYVRNLDAVSDPGLVELFRNLAKEEETHRDAVQEAMRLLEDIRRSGGPPATSRDGRKEAV